MDCDAVRSRGRTLQSTCVTIISRTIHSSCEECSDADEAQKIADHYQRIINAIERQVDEQGGW